MSVIILSMRWCSKNALVVTGWPQKMLKNVKTVIYDLVTTEGPAGYFNNYNLFYLDVFMIEWSYWLISKTGNIVMEGWFLSHILLCLCDSSRGINQYRINIVKENEYCINFYTKPPHFVFCLNYISKNFVSN